MKSLAEWKRALVPNSIWRYENSLRPDRNRISQVTRINTAGVGFETPEGEAWLHWPKASQVSFVHELEGTPAVSVFKGVRVNFPQGEGYLFYSPVKAGA